ncbi:hypothetical protein DL767_003815 [Monosporascus sp. MG133]|nr:hypothetical protein DL767_003815 [Monosporascus sp. MG133]
MASLSRRACYKCGNVGHYAEVCSSAERLCYNCKQPAEPELTGAATTAASPVTWPVLAPTPAGVGMGRGGPVGRGGYGGFPRGGFAGGPRPATCYKCGGPNHFARDCQAQAMKCYACGKLGHISRDCTAPNGGPLNTAGKTCYQCGEAGHISRDCPQKAATNEIPAPVEVPAAAPAIPPVA